MKYFIVDAFTDELFKGNPAGVCLLDETISNDTMQRIAFENNLAETAFLLSENGKYLLRWFTPEVEMDLCGHATLATAFVLMTHVIRGMTQVEFETQSGKLTVSKEHDLYIMNFPSRNPIPVQMPPLLEEALGCKILETHLSRDLLVLVEKAADVKTLQPNIDLLKKAVDAFAVIVTAKGDDCDFVSRFFAPNAGIIEDPVTGSSHSTLIPFWSTRLNKSKMTAKQLSPRGGTLFCENNGERVTIGGNAVCYLVGDINV